MKDKILSLLLAGSMPLSTIHAQALWGKKPIQTKFDWALFMPPVVTKPGPAQAQAASSLLKILPSKNSVAYALFGGLALTVATIAAYKYFSTSEVQKLNSVIILLDKELSKFFYILKLYQSEDDYTKLYTLFSREYKYLKQYNIPGITSASSEIPSLGEIIPVLYQQNPKLQEIVDKIRNIDPKLLSKIEQDQFINEIESIAYQICLFFNLNVKETRPWYRQFTTPISEPLTFDQKKNILIPLARNIKAIENLLRGKKLRGKEQIFFPEQLSKIFDAAKKLLQNLSISNADLETFIVDAAPTKAVI